MDKDKTAKVEKTIVKLFSEKYDNHVDGSEYFIGCGVEMQRIIMEEVIRVNALFN